MCSAICIEKAPFTSFHNSNIVILSLAVLKPLWPLFGSYPSLHTSLRETADNNQPIISCWMAMCPVPTIVLLWHRPVASCVLYSPPCRNITLSYSSSPSMIWWFFSNYLTIITKRGWFSHGSRMILDSFSTQFASDCLRIVLTNIGNPSHTHTHTQIPLGTH